MNVRAITEGIHHLGLTVNDAETTAAFFIEVLGFRDVATKPDYPARFVSDGTIMLTLWQVQSDDAAPFDRNNVLGLHHFALKLSPERKLEDVHQLLLNHPGVEIEFAPEQLGPGPARHFMCTIPGGVRMEIIATS